MNHEALFWKLFNADTESAVTGVLEAHPEFHNPANWTPYGQNRNNFGVVENQQASPIPALVEKIINSIDAILMRRCQEEGIDPKARDAPRTVDDAVQAFFPRSKHWDLSNERRMQAESIQIIADGPKNDTSLLIYDDGEGQHPNDFAGTFLSLLRGNKNEIHFVQGKYNMGGAGAIAFCGQNRYQLIGSKRWDKSGEFGYTLLRRHRLSDREKSTMRSTWYEYFAPWKTIPSFEIQDLDLGLRNRNFETGTIIKLYSYDLPRGSRSEISRDLNQSLTEYLFNPALPFYTIDQPKRYPNDEHLHRHSFGLKDRLDKGVETYLQDKFSDVLHDSEIGSAKVTTYVFKPRVGVRNVADTKRTIRREFFKNNMSVLFSVNGQVHGHYTSEFVSRTLKYQLLKDYVLIHVDCTDLELEFRQELFMASRDRLKVGKHSRVLRDRLGGMLRSGRLKEIYKERKASISVGESEADNLLRSLTKNLSFHPNLVRLFDNALKLEGADKIDREKWRPRKSKPSVQDPAPFCPKRFPTFLKAEVSRRTDGCPMVEIPFGSKRTIKFSTDVEDEYFDRLEEPGEFDVELVQVDRTEGDETRPAPPHRVDQVFNQVTSSPHNGTIRLELSPTNEVQVGDAIKISAKLTGPEGELGENIIVKIAGRENARTSASKKSREREQPGLPRMVLTYRNKERGGTAWHDFGERGIDWSHETVVHPEIDDEDVLTEIIVNMDCKVFLNHRASLNTQEAIKIAERRYYSAVYFHTLFLYTITQNRKYRLQLEDGDVDRDVDVLEYIKDLMENHYAEFLLKFEMGEIISVLDE